MKGNGLASEGDLLGKKDRQYCVVTVEGLKFRLRTMTAREMLRFRRSVEESPERLDRAEELLIAHSWVDGDGNLVTTEEKIWAADEADAKIMQHLSIHVGRWTGWRFDFSAPLIEDQKKTEERQHPAELDGVGIEAGI